MDIFLGGRLRVAVGDITAFEGDAIVNAANSGLLGGGGVDGAIHRAAGPELLDECRALRESTYPEGLPPGYAVATGPGRLPLSAIVHTVGPVWHGGADDEEDLLRSCYRTCLGLANDHGYRTIAFPAISTGVYGYPLGEASRVAGVEVEDWLAAHELPSVVTLVFYSPGDADVFLNEVS